MKIQYENWKPHRTSLKMVVDANTIIEDYAVQGYTITLRQLYYQFVAQDLFANNLANYKKLTTAITKGRLGGLIDWSAINDTTRILKGWEFEESVDNVINTSPNRISFDFWARQDYYVEVWVEKEALGNVIARACGKHIVPYMSCRGYMSSSSIWRAGQRFAQARNEGKDCVLIHLGDHDPSGIDMTRDNDARLELFSQDFVDVRRIALNRDQVDFHKPPPNPAKMTDSRVAEYITNHGTSSWELDALSPKIIETLIVDEIKDLIDVDIWNETRQKELEKEGILRKLANNWYEVQTYLDSLPG